MDGQDYLNQISASTRPVKKSGFSEFLSSKLFLFGSIALGLLIIIIIFSIIISLVKVDVKSLSYSLKIHLDNTAELITKYQPDVKSSSLRSFSSTLNTVLSNTNNDLSGYLTTKYNFKPKDISEKITAPANTAKEALDNELFEAKINGILDRTFTHKITYEISLMMSEESKIINSTGDQDLKDLLTTSYESLSNSYDSFNNYSETK